MEYAMQAEGLVKRFGQTTALAGVDLAAPAGTILGVLGPNGAGKSTAIRILTTLLRPDSGRATVEGFDVVRKPASVRQLIGLTGQYASVDEDLTGAENLTMFGQLLDLRKAAAKSRAKELLEEFELTDAATRRVRTYSGGMRRRLDLAASLIGRPRVVFLDEPTTGLDPGKRDEVWRMIRAMSEDGAAVLLTTQYMEEADALADEITVIDHGKVIAHGTPPELKRLAGGQTVVVRPRDSARITDAASVIRDVVGREADVSRGALVVPVEGDKEFTEIVHRLDTSGISAVEMSLRMPSLDEVFFALTGKHTEESEAA